MNMKARFQPRPWWLRADARAARRRLERSNRRRKETRARGARGRDGGGGERERGDVSPPLPPPPPPPTDRRRLAHVRVIQRNLVYVVGLSMATCREEARAARLPRTHAALFSRGAREPLSRPFCRPAAV
jgi:hypothetical protein